MAAEPAQRAQESDARRCELRLLQLLERPLPAAPVPVVAVQLRLRPAHWRNRRSKAAQGANRPRRRLQPRAAVLLQVLRFRRGPTPDAGRVSRRAGGVRLDRLRRAGGYLLPDLPRHLVRRRRLPGEGSSHPLARGSAPLHQLLPAPRRGTDRAGLRIPRSAREAVEPEEHRPWREHAADPRRLVQEGRRRQPPLDPVRRPGLHEPAGLRDGGPDPGDVRLRPRHLLRLQRVHGYRDRRRGPPRLQVSPQLQPALSRAVAPGVLASVAHHALDVVA